jgi:8-oxo-dGTP pyrophosphatase MutT (NUDIX family)
VAASREYSAGGVVVRKVDDRYELAVIKPNGRNVTGLPKGHIDPGETSQVAAEREVLEETGLEVSLIQKLSDIKYVYRFKGRTIFKVVSFYLFDWRSGTIDQISEDMRKEVDVARWVPLEEAPRALSYPGEREVTLKAIKILDERDAAATQGHA